LQQIDTLVRDPAWLPFMYHVDIDAFVFAYLPRETQRSAVFLDPRFLGETPKSAPIPLRSLPANEIREAAQPVHFIFHTAFCCSTLLTRALDIPGVAMGLKEPSVLVPLAHLRADGRRGRGDPLDIALDLLSRPLAPGETQIIKPSNAANPIARRILETRPSSKAVILYSPLDAYLRSTARMGMTARAFNRQMFTQLASVMPLKTRFSAHDLFLQTDLHIAAQVWLMQAAYLGAAARDFGPSRVRTLRSATLLEDKAGTLARLGDFFGLEADAALWRKIASGPVFDRHAKAQGDAPYDAGAREKADAAHAAEVAGVLAWAEALARHNEVPLDLGDTLLA
jgi:hypothetical protein